MYMNIINKDQNYLHALYEFKIEETLILGSHYRKYIPAYLNELILFHNISDFTLSMTQRQWDHVIYGPHIPEDFPSGLYLKASFRKGTLNVDEKWEFLLNVLGGVFCTSLTTSSTIYSINDTISDNSIVTKMTIVPVEAVCIENLSKWKKMMPCRLQSGLATLIMESKWFLKAYFGFCIHVKTQVDKDTNSINVKYVSRFDVLDRLNLISGSDQSLSLIKFLHKNYGHSDHYHNGKERSLACPLVTESPILHLLQPNAHSLHHVLETRNLSDSIVLSNPSFLNKFILKSTASQNESQTTFSLPYFSSQKYMTGYGSYINTLNVEIFAHKELSAISQEKNIEQLQSLTYTQIMPYFLTPYLHTLRLHIYYVNGTFVHIPSNEISFNWHFPDRKRTFSLIKRDTKTNKYPSTLTFNLWTTRKKQALVLTNLTKMHLSFRVKYKLLPWNEYPPDSKHGFFLPSGIVRYKFVSSKASKTSKSIDNEQDNITKENFDFPLLVMLPVPDFSMPYNVLCFSCTLLALAFGSIFNYCTKSFVIQMDKNTSEPKNKLQKLIGKLKSIIM